MAFSHIVTFKWKTEDFDDAPIASALRALIPHLDGVRDYRCGPDVGLTPSSDDFAVVGVFDGRDSFNAYREHPEHQRILNEMIVPNLDSRTVVQLED